MQQLNIEHQEGTGLRLTDFPDALKAVALRGKKAQELADMTLHRHDLITAQDCLVALKNAEDRSLEQKVFWRLAVISFLKCFGKNNARATQLFKEEVLKGDLMGQEVFEFFKDLRDKNIAHDDNPLMQCLPGAVINKPGAPFKIAKIIGVSFSAEMNTSENIQNLELLITKTRMYVESRFDVLCSELTEELEAVPHADLARMESIEYAKPGVKVMKESRKKLF